MKELKIKISGCFNSCGQHHVADIGFFGNSRRSGNYLVPHFQLVLGGKWKDNAGSYGVAMGAVPSKRVPEVLELLTNRYANERNEGETFQEWSARLGKKEIKAMLEPFTNVPPHEVDASFYTDWGDPREYSLGDIGVGECAGEVVSLFSMRSQRLNRRTSTRCWRWTTAHTRKPTKARIVRCCWRRAHWCGRASLT